MCESLKFFWRETPLPKWDVCANVGQNIINGLRTTQVFKLIFTQNIIDCHYFPMNPYALQVSGPRKGENQPL